MRLTDAEAELVRRLEVAGLDRHALDPWEAWKIFKSYLHIPIDGDLYDAASFQGDCVMTDVDAADFSAYFVRQFSRWEGEEDAGLRRVVIELAYGPIPGHAPETCTVWTHDFPSLAEFATVVEAQPTFQSAMNARPQRTDVYAEDI